MMMGLGLSACANSYYSGSGNIRVLVMAEDEGQQSLTRSSNAFKRILTATKQSLSYKGFHVVDEAMLANDLGWYVSDRRSKHELIRSAKLANQSARGNLSSQALVLLKINTNAQPLRFATKIDIRLSGELYSLQDNRFLGSFELPVQSISAPVACSEYCINEEIGRKARELAAGFGDLLANRLAHLAPTPSAYYDGRPTANDPRCSNLRTTFTLEFKRFSSHDMRQVMNVLSNANADQFDAFPCYVGHDMLSGGNSTLRRYRYTTTANRAKLFDWLNQVLTDFGFIPDQTVVVSASGNRMIIEQIVAGIETNETSSDYKFR